MAAQAQGAMRLAPRGGCPVTARGHIVRPAAPVARYACDRVRTSASPMCASRARLALVGAALVVSAALAGRARAQTEEDGWAPPVAASDRPTSGDASLLSGRTLGEGEVLLAAALGWPGFWAHLELAPLSTVNVGIRAGVLYGSPVMGLRVGGGGELSVPIRVRLWGERDTDMALRLTPCGALGEGLLFGQDPPSTFAGELGWMARLDAEVVFGWHPDPRVTFFFGAGAGGGVSGVPRAGNVEGIGRVEGTLGVEGLLARDTMLLFEAKLGYGLARDYSGLVFYGDRFVLGVSFGVAYLL